MSNKFGSSAILLDLENREISQLKANQNMYRLLDTSSSYGCTHGMIVGNVICSQGVTISSVHALLSPEIVLNDTLNNFFPAI